MNEATAAQKGFTHHGSYYGIPVWIRMEGTDGCDIAMKYPGTAWMINVLHHIEGIMRTIKYPDDPPCFQFTIGAPITVRGKK